MLVKKVSTLTGKTHEMDIPVDRERLERWARGLSNHRLIQDEFPELTATEREFLMTGTTADEWDSLLGDDDDE